MPKFVCHIEVCEDDVYLITHDVYEAETGEEAALLASEDYPGNTVTPACLCTMARIEQDLATG